MICQSTIGGRFSRRASLAFSPIKKPIEPIFSRIYAVGDNQRSKTGTFEEYYTEKDFDLKIKVQTLTDRVEFAFSERGDESKKDVIGLLFRKGGEYRSFARKVMQLTEINGGTITILVIFSPSSKSVNEDNTLNEGWNGFVHLTMWRGDASAEILAMIDKKFNGSF